MATIAGSVKSLSTGVFNVKDESGNVRALKVGDEIYENDTVYGENGNTSSSQVEIQLSGNDVIVLKAGQKQLIDSSLIETAFGTEELFFTRDALDLKADNYNSNADVVSDLRDAEFTGEKKESEQDGAFADANNADATKEETAEGEEEVEDETAGTGEFQARTGAVTDINSDLRNAQFRARTQVFEDKSAFENESKDRLTSLTNTDRPSYTTPSVIQITPSTPPVQQVVTPPPPAAPIIVIGNLSVNDITQYESEGFLIFTVTLDRPVATPVTFDYKTSPITASPNGKDYTDVFGKITIPAGSTTVTIKVPITDDYVSDNGETIKITITNVVGNATITKPDGIGTILDNPVNNPENGTPNTPKEPGGYGEEDTVYAIIVGPGIVNEGNITTDYTIKLIDKDGKEVIVTKDTNVTVKYVNIDTEDNDTQYKNNDKITVTIKAGTSSNTFKVETKDDYISDNNEKYNLSIEKVNTNEFENVVIGDKTGNFKDVTTTILDNSKPDGNTPHDPNEPPKNVEKDAEIVQIKLVALYENGTPVLDSNGNYTFANSVNEGNTAKYMALAFAPGETVFKPSTKLVDQLGTVDVTFGNGTAMGIASQTKTDGSQDFNNTAQAKVALGTVITTATFDDWKADNGETFTISITDKSYAVNVNGGYENVTTDSSVVTTTIYDNSRPKADGTDHNPNNPPYTNVPGNPPSTPGNGEKDGESVILKIVACDASGNPIMDVTDNTKYTFVNTVLEGSDAKYMVLAFKPGTTDFTTVNLVTVQGGTVTIKTADGTAITTGTKDNATLDYKTETTKSVTVGTSFTVTTLDDYLSDNGEKYDVAINNGTYAHPVTPLYENVTTDSSVVTTTIYDNSRPKADGTDHNPNNPPYTNVPGNPPSTPGNGEKDGESVILKIVACDASGNPIMDVTDNTKYTFVNTVLEGSDAKYMVLAFKPGTTDFTTVNLVTVQGGTVTIKTADGTAITTGTKDNATLDYKTETTKSVTVGTSFTVTTLDDYLSDNGEKYDVAINNGTYAHPVTPLYENVTTDSSVVTTTIYDNSRPKADGTDHNPNNPPYTNVPGNPPSTPGNGEKDGESVILKIVACDASGNPIMDVTDNTKYTFVNTVLEGSDAKYMVLAFKPGTTDFTTVNLVTVQGGTVTIKTADGTAITTGTKDNATLDYKTETTKSVTVGTSFTVTTLDDYLSDNGEKYDVAINNGTYAHPVTPLYENVTTDSSVVTTTIYDNSRPKADGTDHNPNNPPYTNVPGNPPSTPGNGEKDGEPVILKIVACDASGNPIMDVTDNTKYTFVNTVLEGSDAKYMVLAFKPGTTDFTTVNLVTVQGGTVTIKTADGTAITTGTKDNATLDYKTETTKSVTVGTSFTVTTLDDYLSDNGEKYDVAINNGTYAHPVTPLYENVTTDSSVVTTTIYDNSRPKADGTDHNPNNPPYTNVPGNPPSTPGNGEKDGEPVILKIVACDASGNPIMDVTDNTKYTFVNTVLEGSDAKYMVLAFKPGTTDFTTVNLVTVQGGTVTIKTADGTAITTGTKDNATLDYKTETTKSVTVGTSFTVTTLDDYLSDNGEKYDVAINNGTYAHPVTPLYENVTTDSSVVTTTIYDNSRPKADGTDHNPNNPPYTNVPGNPPSTPGNGEKDGEPVILKIVACDASGNPIMDVTDNTKYTFVNTVLEGSDAKYMVLAFKPGTTDFTTVNLVTVQGGTVTIKTADIASEATGVTAQTKNDGTQDYILQTSKTVIVGTAFEIKTIKDYVSDNDETYNVLINNNSYTHPVVGGVTTPLYENVITNLDPVTTNITDTATPIVAKIILVATNVAGDIALVDGKVDLTKITNSTPEGGKLYYKAVAVDADYKLLDMQAGKVTITYAETGNPATVITDYTTTIDAGRTSTTATIGTVFSVDAKDDYYAEGNENFTVKISAPTATPYENAVVDTSHDLVTSTIQDNPSKVEQPDTGTENDNPNEPGNYGKDDTVYVKITKTPSTIEGGNLVHTVTLVDKDGNVVTVPAGQSVTVNLTYTSTSNVVTDDDFSTIVKQVIINGGTNHTDFTNITKDDFTSEGDEVYTVTITSVAQSGAFENVAIADSTAPDLVKNLNSTTGTIKDGVSFGTPLNAIVYEHSLFKTVVGKLTTDSKSLGITNPNTDEAVLAFKTGLTTTEKSNGETITYTYSESNTKITAKQATSGLEVFTIKINQNGTYDFELKQAMDHANADGENQFDLPFEFNITSNGTKLSDQAFKVTVVDSVPTATPATYTTNEDTSITIRLADDAFGNGGNITINSTVVAKGDSINIYEPADVSNANAIGTLTNKGDGTVLFTPAVDYSNYDTTKSPQFTYTVADFDGDTASATITINVKPVADAPTIIVSTPLMIEDNTNANEGTHQVGLGLKLPTLSKDSDKDYTIAQDGVAQTGSRDQNSGVGDHPERNGEITLTFTNGDKVTGAKIFNGTTEVADITTVNQPLKIVIVKTSGGTEIDTAYHHSGTLPAKSATVLYLTEAEYQGLKIQHAEDNDTDIKIKIGVTSYELDDNNKPLSALDSAYAGDKTDLDLSKTTEKTMTVKIHPATDNISLNWDKSGGVGSFDADTKTFTFTTKDEGYYFTNAINLQAILTKTSGTELDAKPDLDGSEKRSYTVSGIPEGTIITLGGQSATANALGLATIIFNDTNNKNIDPEFSMKLPEQYSGTVTGKITLSVQDKGVDSGDTAGVIKTAEVYFNVVVTPVADLATIQVSPAVGYEDAGRDGGNTIDKDGTINANGTGGIPLDIKVSSDDKDGSEKFDVTISGIPAGAVIYYDGAEKAGASITITDFDNTKSLVIIPPHNSDADFTLNVSAKTKDGASVVDSPITTIDVIVKNIADVPVGTDLNTNINVNEDNQLNLKSIYTNPENLASYDDSEVLTVKIELPEGFTINSGSPFYIENGLYVVKASDINAGNIKLNVPENFSGNASFKLTYVTTEKAGEGDSKTWNTQTVNIFVNPIADDVTVATSSTINEDADGSANKIDLKPTLTDTDGSETVTSVKILASSVASGYELFLGSANGTSIASKLVGLYYELTLAEADSVYAKNITAHDADNIDSFPLTVVYTVKDTATGTADVTSDFTHTHTVNVKAVTDAPSIAVGTITQTVGNVNVVGTTVTVNTENSEFKVPVTTTSSDTDGSEKVTKIVISGVPMGVEVVGGTYYGYSGSEHNGIWVVTPSGDPATKLDADGALSDIVFKVNAGANFDNREMTITTYTQDGASAEVKSVSTTININKTYTPGTEPGTPAELELAVKTHAIQEDTEFSLASVLGVNEIKAGGIGGGAVITITDIPEGSKVTGADYSYEKTIGGVTKTYYVVVGNGNAADMNTQLADVKITTPKDMNSLQVAPLKGSFTFTADIATNHNGGFNKGNQVTSTQDIAPVTDKMTVAVSAENIDEDVKSNISITLSNPSDGSKTELVGNSLVIKVTETWKDVATGGGTKGTLTDSSGKYTIVESPVGTYTITPINVADKFVVGTAITGLQYTPASNRDGDVKFEVSVKNKETGSTLELDSAGDKTITVAPKIDAVLNASVVTATGTEDVAVTVGATTLANPVKLEITAGTFVDGSEKIGNIILDEVPNGFTVWYKVGIELVMATNIGTTTGVNFDLTPNIAGDADATRNKWLVPSSADGSIPEVYINAPTNWSGDFGFKAKFTISEQNLSTVTPIEVDVTGKIISVADAITIAPTLTFGEAFSWVDLKLNANMTDIDGSETMSLKITGLDDMAQFQLANGTAVNSLYNTVTNTWELKGITYDQINNIQFAHDKSVASVGVTANTVEKDNIVEGDSTSSVTFELKVSDVSGNFKLDAGLSLDFNKIDTINTLKNIDTIDLTQTGSNKLLNLSLQDVLDMSGSNKEIKITGTGDDEVSFKTGDGWNAKTAGTGSDAGFDIYTNSGDSSVKVKVEQDIPII